MELVLDRCSIVIVGAWNLAILRPEWVGKRLFSDEPELEFGIELQSGAGPVTYFQSKNVWTTASTGKLEFKPLRDDAESFSAIEEAAVTLLNALPETPLVACGVNYGFTDAENESLERLLTLPDHKALEAAQASVSATAIRRTVVFSGQTFQFLVQRDEVKGGFYMDFNHHHPVATVDACKQVLRGAVTNLRGVSQRFLDSIYAHATMGAAR